MNLKSEDKGMCSKWVHATELFSHMYICDKGGVQTYSHTYVMRAVCKHIFLVSSHSSVLTFLVVGGSRALRADF